MDRRFHDEHGLKSLTFDIGVLVGQAKKWHEHQEAPRPPARMAHGTKGEEGWRGITRKDRTGQEETKHTALAWRRVSLVRFDDNQNDTIQAPID